jgi:Protein of unknown function (DUF4239)
VNAFVAFFEGLPLPVGAIAVIGGFVALSVVLAKLTHRFLPVEVLREHNDLTGFIFAVVGVIYAVILGFVAIGVWERFAAAESATYAEASPLATIYRGADAIPRAAEVRRELRLYAHDIVELGWPAMASGRTDPHVELEAERIAVDINTIVPRNAREANLQQQMMTAAAASLTARDQRLAEDATGLNGLMWSVVIFGGFITVGFTYLFGFKQSLMQTLMIGTLALLIGLVIYLTMSLDYPFRGPLHVQPDAFERIITIFNRIDTDQTRADYIHARLSG